MPDDNDTNDRLDEETKYDPMTDAQRIQLDTLSDEAGEPTPGEHLSRTEAKHMIDELREEAVSYDTSTDDLDEP